MKYYKQFIPHANQWGPFIIWELAGGKAVVQCLYPQHGILTLVSYEEKISELERMVAEREIIPVGELEFIALNTLMVNVN